MNMTSSNPIELFYSYSHIDEKLRDQLEKHLTILQRQGFITTWHDRRISAGAEWAHAIDAHINSAQIILLLVSSDFLASAYCYDIEMQRAMERHEEGEARVIPVILRPVDWYGAPFGKLQALPRDGKPVTKWDNTDEAWVDIVTSIRLVCEELQTPLRTTPSTSNTSNNGVSIPPPIPSHIYELEKVFLKSGVPDVTFVEPPDFELLKLSLAQPGRGAVIEGPSGIGKTTAIKKALEQLEGKASASHRVIGSLAKVMPLSARKPEDRNLLKTLSTWHEGTVIIDDFHRLETDIAREITDYLKYLADTEPESKKLVIIGIPQTGQTMIDMWFDIATRIDVFKWGKVSSELVLRMIEKGEQALNIEFDRKAEIAIAASGSLNVAQFLCFHICQWDHVLETPKELKPIQCNIEGAVRNVMAVLSGKFRESIRRFAAMGGKKDHTCIQLLEELAHSEEGFLSLPWLRQRKPELAQGIEQFIREKWMDILYQEYPTSAKHLFFDATAQALVVDDPQLTFYLNRLQFSVLLREVGKAPILMRKRVFISYSHKDARWAERLLVHLSPLKRDNLIDTWVDTQIAPGARWRDEIEQAIESASVAILLVSAEYLASEFIAEQELPKLLSAAEANDTLILPVILRHCLFDETSLARFQAVNNPEKPLSSLPEVEREKVWVKLTKIITDKLSETEH